MGNAVVMEPATSIARIVRWALSCPVHDTSMAYGGGRDGDNSLLHWSLFEEDVLLFKVTHQDCEGFWDRLQLAEPSRTDWFDRLVFLIRGEGRRVPVIGEDGQVLGRIHE